jgi:hypothetical protein
VYDVDVAGGAEEGDKEWHTADEGDKQWVHHHHQHHHHHNHDW